MYHGLKSVSPVPPKQSLSENERFIVIQHKPHLKLAFTGLDQAGEINPSHHLTMDNLALSPPPTTNTILKVNPNGFGFRCGKRIS